MGSPSPGSDQGLVFLLGSCCRLLHSFPNPRSAAPAHSPNTSCVFSSSPLLTPSHLYPGYPRRDGAALPSTERVRSGGSCPGTRGKRRHGESQQRHPLQPAQRGLPAACPAASDPLRTTCRCDGKGKGLCRQRGPPAGKGTHPSDCGPGGLLPDDTVTLQPSCPVDSCTQTSQHGQLCPSQPPSHLPLAAILPSSPVTGTVLC